MEVCRKVTDNEQVVQIFGIKHDFTNRKLKKDKSSEVPKRQFKQ